MNTKNSNRDIELFIMKNEQTLNNKRSWQSTLLFENKNQLNL